MFAQDGRLPGTKKDFGAMSRHFVVGDRVVYSRQKHSSSPGPRAQEVTPAAHGESYSYLVDKYWRVIAVEPDGILLVRTRRGKQHRVRLDDPRLRRPTIWERLFRADRFPEMATSSTEILGVGNSFEGATPQQEADGGDRAAS
jgi:hypothetical protein